MSWGGGTSEGIRQIKSRIGLDNQRGRRSEGKEAKERAMAPLYWAAAGRGHAG